MVCKRSIPDDPPDIGILGGGRSPNKLGTPALTLSLTVPTLAVNSLRVSLVVSHCTENFFDRDPSVPFSESPISLDERLLPFKIRD